jgi:myo-inositol-1(or 4)-monophosphatase
MDAYWEFNLNPWDTAAGFLLVEEAGGMVTGFDGTYRRLDSREILASNQLIHHELLSLFKDMLAGRNLAPLPSPAEYAAGRAERAAAGVKTAV